jgi:hypothetical protein
MLQNSTYNLVVFSIKYFNFKYFWSINSLSNASPFRPISETFESISFMSCYIQKMMNSS